MKSNKSANCAPFSKVRSDHATETAEDYVEAVSDILREHGQCRVKDLVRVMGVSHVTVTRIIARLQELNLVTTEPYRPIHLTPKGERLAAESRSRHQLVYEFLLAIGVPDEDALRDSEGIEHHVGDRTLRCMRQIVETTNAHRERST